MVQRASHGVVDDQSSDERAVIVGAVGADGEELVARAGQQDVIVADAADNHPTRLERADLCALGEIRLGQCHLGVNVPPFSMTVSTSFERV